MKKPYILTGSVVLLGIGWYLLSPMIINTTVDEKISVRVESESTVVVEGSFTDADSFHKGSGTVRILELEGLTFLRFENFEVTNGPTLHVLLSRNPSPTSSDELGEYVDLGKLKGNIGNQNYNIPEGTAIEEYGSVVIYCKPFKVIFTTATLNQ